MKQGWPGLDSGAKCSLGGSGLDSSSLLPTPYLKTKPKGWPRHQPRLLSERLPQLLVSEVSNSSEDGVPAFLPCLVAWHEEEFCLWAAVSLGTVIVARGWSRTP